MMDGRLGVQMYTLREAFDADTDDAVARIAASGIEGVEVFALGEPFRAHGERLERSRRLGESIRAGGLEVIAAHTSLPAMDDPQWIFEEVAALGANMAICSSPDRVLGFTRDVFDDDTRLARFAERLNNVSAFAGEQGIQIGFHNHWTEWRDHHGRPAYDVFAELLNPEIIFEIDVFWAMAGGQDPASVIRDHSERVKMLHLKDGLDPVPGAPQSVLGEGVLPLQDILAAAPRGAWHILENDVVADGMDVWDVVEASAKRWREEAQ
jgi:sugar phosphate isomerase/epimerase